MSTLGNGRRGFIGVIYVPALAVVWKLLSLEGNKSLGKGMISKPSMQEMTLTQAVTAGLAA